jgi:hypothetical protein
MVRGTSSYMLATDNLGSVTTITGTCGRSAAARRPPSGVT